MLSREDAAICREHEKVLDVAISGDGQLLVLKFDHEPYLRVVECKEPDKLCRVLPDGGPGLAFFFADQTSYNLVCETPKSVIVVNAKTGKMVRPLDRMTSLEFVISSSIGGRYLAVCTFGDELLYRWDLKLGDLTEVPVPECKGIDSACISPDGTHVAVCCQGAPPVIVSLITREVVLKLDIPWATGVEYSSDGKLLVTLGEEVAVWEADTGKLNFKTTEKLQTSAEAVFTPDNDLMVAIAGVGVYLVNAERFIKAEDRRITLSPGGRFVVFRDHHNNHIEVAQFKQWE